MIGREQALGPFPLTARTYYTLFGSDHFGLRVRAMHLGKLLAGLKPPQRILDAGCSGGWYCFYMVCRYPSAQVLGVDLDSSSLQNAEIIRRRLGQRGKRIAFQNADLTMFRANEAFDLICCIDVLEHVVDDEQVLNNLRASLNTNGVLLLHVPQRTRLNRYVLPNSPAAEMSEGHVREYTKEEIISKMQWAGFEIQEIRYTFGWAGSLARELYYKIEKVHPPLLRAVSKGIAAPFLLLLAYGDTIMKNGARHQGFFIRACPARLGRFTA